MKKNIILLFLLFSFVGLSAQERAVLNIFDVKKDPVMYGVKAGVTVPRMAYSLEEYSEIEQMFSVRPAFGLFVDIPLNPYISVAPEVLYISRGVNHEEYVFRNRYDACFVLKSRYIDLRVPFIYKFNVRNNFQPYIFAAPDVAMCIGGKMKYDIVNVSDKDDYASFYIDQDLTTTDISQFDISVLVGVGARYKIKTKNSVVVVKLDVGYNYGFVNNFGVTPDYITKITGKRYNRPFECLLSVAMPINIDRFTHCNDFGSKYDRWY